MDTVRENFEYYFIDPLSEYCFAPRKEALNQLLTTIADQRLHTNNAELSGAVEQEVTFKYNGMGRGDNIQCHNIETQRPESELTHGQFACNMELYFNHLHNFYLQNPSTQQQNQITEFSNPNQIIKIGRQSIDSNKCSEHFLRYAILIPTHIAGKAVLNPKLSNAVWAVDDLKYHYFNKRDFSKFLVLDNLTGECTPFKDFFEKYQNASNKDEFLNKLPPMNQIRYFFKDRNAYLSQFKVDLTQRIMNGETKGGGLKNKPRWTPLNEQQKIEENQKQRELIEEQ